MWNLTRVTIGSLLAVVAIGCGQGPSRESASTPPPAPTQQADAAQQTDTAQPRPAPKPVIVAGVAVIDLDRVAQALGRDKQMQQQVNSAQASLNDQLQQVRTTLLAEYHRKKATVDVQPSGKQKQQQLSELKQYDAQLGQQLNRTKQQAKVKLATYRNETIGKFRAEVKRIARLVAAERDMPVVLTKNDAVLFTFEAEADITTTVIERMQAQEDRMAAATAAPQGQSQPLPR